MLNKFSFANASGGFASGVVIVVFINLISTFNRVIFIHEYNEAKHKFDQLSLSDYIYAIPMFWYLFFAIVGFIWEGFNITREKNSLPFGILGFIFGGLLGVTPVVVYLSFGSNGVDYKLASALFYIFGIIGFLWNGMKFLREKFSIPFAFIGMILGGIICGIISFVVAGLAVVVLGLVTLGILIRPLGWLVAVVVIIAIIIGMGYGFFMAGIRAWRYDRRKPVSNLSATHHSKINVGSLFDGGFNNPSL